MSPEPGPGPEAAGGKPLRGNPLTTELGGTMQHGRADYNFHIQVPASVIPTEEPVFLLRAQDRAAAPAVRAWAAVAQALGADPEVVKNALHQADLMDAWPVKKIPDSPD